MYTREPKMHLRHSLVMSSAVEAQAVAMEFIKNWFLSKFNDNFFKYINVDKKFMLSNYKYKNFKLSQEALTVEKPALTIFAQIQNDWDRENIDLHQMGINRYRRRSPFDTHFFKDPEKNIYLGIGLDQLFTIYNFRLRLNTKAEQLDTASFMSMAFNIGCNRTEDIDLDMHVPYSLMIQLAKDAGFEVVNNTIKDTTSFVSYLNQHSVVPVLYKFRAMTGKGEYFLRMWGLPTLISCQDSLSVDDDGEREGHMSSNFGIDFMVNLKMPRARYFTYYSQDEHKLNLNLAPDQEIGLYNIKVPEVPELNSKGWVKTITTQCIEEDLSKPLEIHFEGLFSGDLSKLIEKHKKVFISPSLFIDFKLYNNGDKLDFEIDWDKMIISTNTMVTDHVTNKFIYLDKEYINSEIIQDENLLDINNRSTLPKE